MKHTCKCAVHMKSKFNIQQLQCLEKTSFGLSTNEEIEVVALI